MMRKTGRNRFGGGDQELFRTYSLRSPLGDHVEASSRRCITQACRLEERHGLEMLRLKAISAWIIIENRETEGDHEGNEHR